MTTRCQWTLVGGRREGPMEQVGSLRRMVVSVDDLDAGAEFWSRLTGLPVTDSPTPDRVRLGVEGTTPWQQTLTLQEAPQPKAVETNRAHVDLTIDDVDVAIEQIEALGGRRKTDPSVYPRPCTFAGEPPVIDWVVMQDPFGNEFCLVRVLDDAEVAALEQAGEAGPAEDAHWRAVARTARYEDSPPRAPSAPPMGTGECVGPLRCYAIDVDDLASALHFWTSLTGLPPIHSEWPGRFAYLGYEDETRWEHALILHFVDRPKTDVANRLWLELEVSDLAAALRQIDAIGGRRSDDADVASGRVVARDPFGNEFCLLSRPSG